MYINMNKTKLWNRIKLIALISLGTNIYIHMFNGTSIKQFIYFAIQTAILNKPGSFNTSDVSVWLP